MPQSMTEYRDLKRLMIAVSLKYLLPDDDVKKEICAEILKLEKNYIGCVHTRIPISNQKEILSNIIISTDFNFSYNFSKESCTFDVYVNDTDFDDESESNEGSQGKLEKFQAFLNGHLDIKTCGITIP